jgi:hypothetical protein
MSDTVRITIQRSLTTPFQSNLGTRPELDPLRDEILVPDERASLGPAQMVENKLKDLGQGSCRVSQLRLMSLISARR